MEDNNLKLYYFGLEDVMNEGCVRPEHVIPEGWGKSIFTGSIVDLSFYYFLSDLIRVCNSNNLERVAEVVGEMNDHRDYYSRRFTSNELYKALSIIRSDTASFLLGKIECSEGVFSEASDALSMKDQSRFVKAIKDCNSAIIKPIVNCILYLQNMKKVFELKKRRVFGPKRGVIGMTTNGEIVADGIETAFSLTSNEDSIVATDILGNDYVLDIFNNSIKENQIQLFSQLLRIDSYFNPCYPKKGPGVDLKKCNIDLLCSCKYFAFLFQYCRIKDSYVSFFGKKNAFEYLFKLPAVRGLYDEGMKYWKQNCWEKKLAECESYLLNPENCEDTTASIREPNSQKPVAGSAFTWRLPLDFFDKSNIDTCKIDEYIPGFLEGIIRFASITNDELSKLKLHLNNAFEEFIETLAENNCIDNDYVTKASFAHALTGRKVDVETLKVRWKYTQSKKLVGWLNNICHIVRYLYPRDIYDKEQKKLDKYGQIARVFNLDFDSIPPEERSQRTPQTKISSSYADNADDFIKDAVKKFINTVRIIKKSVCNIE